MPSHWFAFLFYAFGIFKISLSERWGTLRLMDGTTPLDGRVEIFVEKWRTMCDKHITLEVAEVICRELGYPPTDVVLLNDSYKKNKISFMKCDGSESRLILDCHWAVWPEDECTPEDNRGIHCRGNVRLYDNITDEAPPTSGNIELFRDGKWTNICDNTNTANYQTAKVICKQMGLHFDGERLTAGSYFGDGRDSNYAVSCQGNELNINDCQFSPYICDGNNTLGVDCNVTTGEEAFYELTGNNVTSAERNVDKIDVTGNGLSNYWCTNLANPLNMKRIAQVICFELGLSRYEPEIYEYAYRPSDTVLDTNSINCYGKEDQLSQCTSSSSTYNTECEEYGLNIVGVLCNAVLRLADGTWRSNGRVEILDHTSGEWQPLSVANKEHAIAKVVCKQLGYIGSKVTHQHNNYYGKGWTGKESRHRYICTGKEYNLRECQLSYTSVEINDTLGVDCRDESSIPSLSLDSANSTANGFPVVVGATSKTYICADDSDTSDYVASVMCYQMGYSRFGAEMTSADIDITTSPVDRSVSTLVCIGTEHHIGQCSRGKLSPTETTCSTTLVLKCQDPELCSDRSYTPDPKSVSCNVNFCQTKSCDNYRVLDCNLDEHNGCKVESLYTRKGNIDYEESKYWMCQDNCFSEFVDDSTHYRSAECCFSNLCNVGNKTVRSDAQVQIIDGWIGTTGDVQIRRSSTWYYVEDTGDVTTKYINYICTKSGYYNSQSAKIPYRHLDNVPCIKGIEYETCGRTSDDIESCGGQIAICSGKVLAVNCNARTPPMRIVDGPSRSIGRLEVQIENEWGTICNQDFDDVTAAVMCRSMGFQGQCRNTKVTNFNHLKFPTGSGPIHFTGVRCKGNERNLLHCDYTTPNKSSPCTHANDVSIVCEEIEPLTSTDGISPPTEELNPEVESSGTGIPKDNIERLSCYEGECVGSGCMSQSMWRRYSICEAGTNQFCYMDTRNIESRTHMKYGCLQDCVPRSSLAERARVFCCQTPKCNRYSEEEISVDRIFFSNSNATQDDNTTTNIINETNIEVEFNADVSNVLGIELNTTNTTTGLTSGGVTCMKFNAVLSIIVHLYLIL